MAKGKKCPSCGHPMYAVREDDQPKGSWVYYKCRNGNCNFEEKVFEGKSTTGSKSRVIKLKNRKL